MIVVFLGIIVPARASGQETRFALELRSGAAIPIGSFREGGSLGVPVDRGVAFGARFVYRTAPTTAIQLGFNQDRAACDACPGGEPYIGTLWDAGLRFGLEVGDVHTWALMAVLFGRVEGDLMVSEGVEEGVSDLTAGGTAGIGFDAPIRGRLRIAPAVRWVAINTRFPDRGLLRMRYAVVDVGLMFGF